MKLHLDELTIDPEIQLRARGVDSYIVRSYIEAIANDAQMPPIVAFHEDGVFWLADGFHRVEAYRFLGLAEVEAEVHKGTRDDALLYAATANVANGKPMSQAEKREAGERLLRMTEWSQARIARELAVGQSSVQRWAADLSYPNGYDRPTTVTRGGTTYTMDTSSIGRQELEPAPEPEPQPPRNIAVGLVDVLCQQCGRVIGRQDSRYPWTWSTLCEQCKQERKDQPLAVHFSSATPEHYTPGCIIEAALACLGAIDLDPCSNSHEDPVVPAAQHFTAEDDGLAQEWHGRVYMNPPYGREIDRWVAKLYEEHRNGGVTEAIALVPARTDTQWWQKLRDFPVCFIEGRLTFGGNDDPAPFPSAVFYLGENVGGFYWSFDALGDLWQRMIPGISFGE